MTELFSREMIDFPITYPITWGLPSHFPGTEGQVINAWAEGMPASMYCNACGESDATPADAAWRAETGNRLAYFLGFDNAYFWGVTHLALLMAHEVSICCLMSSCQMSFTNWKTPSFRPVAAI